MSERPRSPRRERTAPSAAAVAAVASRLLGTPRRVVLALFIVLPIYLIFDSAVTPRQERFAYPKARRAYRRVAGEHPLLPGRRGRHATPSGAASSWAS